MRELAIEGVDGVGKTTLIGELKLALEEDGQTVAVAAPYHDVSAEHPGIDITAAMHNPRDSQDVLNALALVIGRAEIRARDEHASVLIYDRHWMTAHTELMADDERHGVWVAGKPKTVLLDPDTNLSPELYDRLIHGDEPWCCDKDIVNDYIERYRKLAHGFSVCMLGDYRVDHLTTPEKLAKTIRWDMRILR